jgi:hypothetical protein
MPVGLRHIALAASVALFIALAAPTVAFAGTGGNCSACQVYSEPYPPSAGQHQQPPSPPPGGGQQTQPSKGLSRVLAQAGQDKGPLVRVLGDSGSNSLQAGDVGSPGLFGTALDLGAGPTALLAILLATALALGARGSIRRWRLPRRRPSA